MGTARDGRVSKDFGDGKTKIKVRFSDERQARRVSFMLQYIQICIKDGADLSNLDDVSAIENLMAADLRKAAEVMGKIQERHEGVRDGNGTAH